MGLRDVYDSSGKVIPGYSAITRLDRGTTLSIMGKRYVPLQNREAFTALDDLIQDGLSIKKAREIVSALEALEGIDWIHPMEYWLSETGHAIVSEKIRPLVNRIKFS